MFDTYNHKGVPSSVNVSMHSTVQEHRAPTDHSVQLLREMEKASADKVLNSLYIDNNEFKFLIQRYNDPHAYRVIFGICFEINGKRYMLEHSEMAHKTPEEVVKGIHKALSEKIATVLLSSVNISKEVLL